MLSGMTMRGEHQQSKNGDPSSDEDEQTTYGSTADLDINANALVLPLEIINHILSYLPPSSLATTIRASRAFHLLSLSHLYSDLVLDLDCLSMSSAMSRHPLFAPSLSSSFAETTPASNGPITDPEKASVLNPRMYVKTLRILPHHDGCHVPQDLGHGQSGSFEHGHRIPLDKTLTFMANYALEQTTPPTEYTAPDPNSVIYVPSFSSEIGYRQHQSGETTLPRLDTLHLSVHPDSPVGWRFCSPSDRVRYPYYPASNACPLLDPCSHTVSPDLGLGTGLCLCLRPRKTVVEVSKYWNSPSPFPTPIPLPDPTSHAQAQLQCQPISKTNYRDNRAAEALPVIAQRNALWDKAHEVTLKIMDYSPGPKTSYNNGFIDTLPLNVKTLNIIFLFDTAIPANTAGPRYSPNRFVNTGRRAGTNKQINDDLSISRYSDKSSVKTRKASTQDVADTILDLSSLLSKVPGECQINMIGTEQMDLWIEEGLRSCMGWIERGLEGRVHFKTLKRNPTERF